MQISHTGPTSGLSGSFTPIVGSSTLQRGTAAATPGNTEATIATHTVIGANLFLDGFIADGEVDAEFRLYINTVLKITYRSSEQDRTAKLFVPAPIKLAVGDIVDLKVIHFYPLVTADFQGTIFGHKV